MNRIRIGIAAVSIVGGTLIVAPGFADAHDAVAQGSCLNGVTWDAHDYEKTEINSIVVKVDGVIVHADPDFKASDVGSFATDKTKAHTWSVDVNAPGTQYDRHRTGSYQACQEIPPTTTAPTTTTVIIDEPTTTTRVPNTEPTRTFTASGICDDGVTWNAVGFVNSVITVTVDGSTVLNGPVDSTTASGRVHTDNSLSHTWSVVITGQSANAVGSIDACVEAPVPTVAVDLPPVPATNLVLPATGSSRSTGLMLMVATGLVLAGVVMCRKVARR